MTQRLPRASLCITILQDEDYFTLMRSPGGTEAFGAFVAMVVVARERLQQNKAVQVEGTHAIRLLNSIPHLAAMAHLGEEALTKAIATLGSVAGKTNSEPWMSVDEHGNLVIRSFFKFNTSSGWGGPRDSPSKPPKTKGSKASRKQDESKSEQLAPNLGSSCAVSGSGSGSGSLIHTHPQAPAKKQQPDPDPIPPPGPISPPPTPAGSVGVNIPADVDRVLALAEEIDPLGKTRIWARQWLHDHPARFVIECMTAASDKADPCSYAGKLIAQGPKAVAPRRPRPPEPPALKPWVPPVLPDSMFDLTPEEEAILARKGKTA